MSRSYPFCCSITASLCAFICLGASFWRFLFTSVVARFMSISSLSSIIGPLFALLISGRTPCFRSLLLSFVGVRSFCMRFVATGSGLRVLLGGSFLKCSASLTYFMPLFQALSLIGEIAILIFFAAFYFIRKVNYYPQSLNFFVFIQYFFLHCYFLLRSC